MIFYLSMPRHKNSNLNFIHGLRNKNATFRSVYIEYRGNFKWGNESSALAKKNESSALHVTIGVEFSFFSFLSSEAYI